MTAVDPWGGAALSSSLGGNPVASPGGDPWSGIPAASASGGGSHGTGWFGSWKNPLGLVSGVKNMATGLASSFGSIAAHGISGLVDTGYQAASGISGQGADWSQPGREFGHAAQGVGDIVGGLQLGVEDLSMSAASVVGEQNILRDDIWRPINHLEAGKNANGPGTWNYLLSPEMSQRLYGQGKGFGPAGFLKDAQEQGIGAAAMQTAAEASIVAGPIAGAAGAVADDAAGAAAAAAARGAVEDAASYAGREAALRQVADVASGLHSAGRFGYNPIGAVGQLAADKLGTAADTAEAGAEEGAAPPRSAVLARRAAALGQFASSPLKFVGLNAADLLGAMREQSTPAQLPVEPHVGAQPEAGAQEAAQGVSEQPTPEELSVVRTVQNPQTAAAEAMGTTVPDDPYAQLKAAGQAAAQTAEAQGVHPTSGLSPEPPPTEGTVRLYRVGGTGGTDYTEGAPNPQRASGTAPEDMGRRSFVDVPQETAAALQRGPNGEISLADHPDLLQATQEYQPETPTEPAPKAQPVIEPARYKAETGLPPMSKEDVAARDAQLRLETAAARDTATPSVYVYDQLGERMQAPTPLWAKAVAEKLPTSINAQLGKLAGFVDEVRMRNLERSLTQTLETSQQITRSSEGMKIAIDSAASVLDRTTSRSQASDIIGQEIFSRLYGENAIAEYLKTNNYIMPSDVQRSSLLAAIRGRYPGMTDEMWAKLTPDEKVTLTQRLNDATQLFKQETVATRQTLLASRYGAKGLEHSLLDPNDIGMTREQMRLYARSVRDMRFAEKALERVPAEQAKAAAKAALAEADGRKAWGLVDKLRATFGLKEATAAELFRGIPDGMRNDAEAVIGRSLDAIAAGAEHVVIDPATGSIEPPTEGIFVPMSLQGPGVSLDNWASQGHDTVRNAILFPTSTDGLAYDPVRLFTGMDARVVLARITGADGSVTIQPILGMHSINGEPIVPWQARILGDAYEQHAGFNFADHSNVPFSDTPMQQTIAQWYVGDVLDPRSGLSRWANEKAAVATELGIGPEQLNAEITANLTLDQVMAQRDNLWKQGDIFKTETSIGKGEPFLPHLLQTIMPDLSTADHFTQALATADFESVSKALAWYYTSHDAIESLWRGLPTPFGRDAAETFYDVLALTSVMASPTQNLGRALAGYANLDDFLSARTDAIDNTHQVINELMGNKPAEVTYVKNLGVTRDSYLQEFPRKTTENKTTFERRIARNIEQEVGKGEGGTAVSRRWLQSPAARDLTAQTSMTTSPKYRIIDALLGRLDLSTATAEDIGRQPEFWMGQGVNFSDAKLDPFAVMHHADLLGIHGPAVDAYRDWAWQHESLVAAKHVREDPNYVAPIRDSEDVQRKASPSAEGGREISPQENQDLGRDGQAIKAQAAAQSSPTVDLRSPDFIQSMYDATRQQWGGGTLDTHTGQFVPTGADVSPDLYAVTTREPTAGDKTIEIDPNADLATFSKAWHKALNRWGDKLAWDKAGFGVFHNVTPEHPEGVIELDPTLITNGVHDTEAVGVASHSVGGAFHFATLDGHWVPHVRDDLSWSAKSGKNGPAKDVAASVEQGRALAKSPELRPAYENALMEYHGSGLLAKLRSFRDNLANPHTSLAVTLDSIMAQLWGIEGTPWARTNEYADKADEVRDVAKAWTPLAGRTVMPHEVQAALWVHAKRFIGEQDWGRWNAHMSNGLSEIDDLEKARKDGNTIDVPSTHDLLAPAWKEELQFSRDQQALRTERTPLRAKASAAGRGGPALTPEESDRLAYLESVPGRQTSQVQVQTGEGAPVTQQRDETYYDANTLRGKEEQYVSYLTKYAAPIVDALRTDNFDEARKLLREYVISRQRSMLNGIDGDAMDAVLAKGAKDPASVTYQSLARLAQANHVPHPNVEGINGNELMSRFADRVRGLTIEQPNSLGRIMMRLYQSADFTTMLHEDLHAFRLMAPGDEVARLSEEYPHIQDATMTPERRADEERFVQDFMAYMHERARAGDPNISPEDRAQASYTGPLHDTFNNVADAIDEYSRAALNTTTGHTISDKVLGYWDSIFNQEIVKPDRFQDPLSSQYAAENRGVNPQQLRGESDFNYTQRVRQYGEARGALPGLKQDVAEATRRAQHADKFATQMKSLMDQPTRSEAIAAKLQQRATNTLGKISNQLDNPTGTQVPKPLRPFMDAIDLIREEAKTNPEMAPILDEIGDNFPKALQFAAQLGWEPAYMPDLTWQMAQRFLYGHLTLGENAEESSMRKLNRGVLSKAGVTDRSMEALGAGSVMAMRELLQSMKAQFVEENYARQWRAGVAIPDGWKPWSATRDAILTGRTLDGKNVPISDTLIIPEAVDRVLRKMQNAPVDMPFRTLWKGGPTAVWKNLILTYSPSWYIKHFIGSTTLAALEGVRLQDWRTAYKQWKANDYPDVVKGKTIYAALDLESHTMIPRNKIADMPDLVRSEGVRAAVHEVTAKLQNVVKTVDSFNRAAVYAKTIRLTDNPALAASRAIEALGDFGRLSPLERSAVSSVIPFYSFQKAMFRVLARLPVDHPYVTTAVIQLGLMHQAYLQDKLGGQVPDAYMGAVMLNGHLTPLDKMNPLTDSYKLITPEGLAASLHPFIKPFAEDAFGGQSYGSGVGMSPTGVLQPQANYTQQFENLYSNIPALGGSPLNVYSGLSDKQYNSLVKRIAKFGKAKQLVDNGGYLVTDANAAKKKASASPWG